MRFKVISCKVLQRELEFLAPDSPHELEIEYFDLGEHARPGELRRRLQEKIDASNDCDAVLLGYGLCGRATDGLKARRVPLVLPRSHDCGGILLGSRRQFEEIFKPMPSTPFSCIGFAENGEYYFRNGEMLHGDAYAELVEQYGEDNAQYVWDAMHPKLDGQLLPVYFIHTLPSPESLRRCREKAAAEQREIREVTGNLRLLRMLLNGIHPADEFLTVPPGAVICQTGDWDCIIEAKPDSN